LVNGAFAIINKTALANKSAPQRTAGSTNKKVFRGRIHERLQLSQLCDARAAGARIVSIHRALMRFLDI
jgi:hypothetical protein